MSDNDDDLKEHPEREGLPPGIREQLRKSDKLASDLAASETARQAAESELVIRDAGLTDGPLRALFVQGYKGEMTIEAIKAEAAKYPGLLVDPAAAGATTTGAEDAEAAAKAAELAAMKGGAQAAAGAPAGGPIDFGDALAAANTPDEIKAVLRSAPEAAGLVLVERVAR